MAPVDSEEQDEAGKAWYYDQGKAAQVLFLGTKDKAQFSKSALCASEGKGSDWREGETTAGPTSRLRNIPGHTS